MHEGIRLLEQIGRVGQRRAEPGYTAKVTSRPAVPERLRADSSRMRDEIGFSDGRVFAPVP